MPFIIVQKEVRVFFFLIQVVFGPYIDKCTGTTQIPPAQDKKPNQISFLLEHWSKMSFSILNNMRNKFAVIILYKT